MKKPALSTSKSTLLNEALRLGVRPEENFLELAGVLRALREERPDQIRTFIKRSGMSRRKTYYLLKLSKHIDRIRAPKSRLREIGWTKLELISEHLTNENTATLLKLAENTNAQQLKLEMRGEKSKTNMRCVTLYFSAKEYRQFEHALLQNGGTRHGRGLAEKEQAIIRAIGRVHGR